MFIKSLIALITATLVMCSQGNAATQLFKSDFGGTVAMGTPNITGSTSGWWPIIGGDDGFTWPPNINGGASQTQGLQPISTGPSISYNATTKVINCGGSPCWKAEIISGTRHDGTTGPMLHQQNFQNIYYQLPYIITPGSDVIDQYQKFYMKFPSNIGAQMGPNAWRVFTEWKDSGYTDTSCPLAGYRMIVFINTDANSVPYWNMSADSCPAGPFYFNLNDHTHPVPVGVWFKAEWSWHRTHDSTSSATLKINDTLIFQQNGGGTNSNGFYKGNFPMDRDFLFQMYGGDQNNVGHPSEQWIDAIEIWDVAPTGDTTAPTIPAGLSATAVSQTQINLSWTASTDAVGVTGYKVYRAGTQIGTSATTTFQNTGLTANTAYSYTVAAYDAAGNTSAQSSAASATTQPVSGPAIATSATNIPAGGALVATVTNGPATPNDWVGLYPLGAPFDYALGTQWKNMNDTQTAPATGIANATIHLNASTTLGQYEFRLYKGTDATLQATSPTITVVSGGDTTAPTVPSGLSAIPVSSTAVNLSWTASTDAVGVTGYNVYRGGVKIGTSATTSYSDTGLTASTAYVYTVSAFDAVPNTSAQSSPVNVTTLPPPDTTAPTVSISGSSITATATANDNVGVTSVDFYVNGTMTCHVTASPYVCSFPATLGTSYVVNAQARDAAGNVGTSTNVTYLAQ